MRYIKWVGIGLLVLVVFGLIGGARMGFRTSDRRTLAYFQKRGVPVTISRLPFQGDSIRVIESQKVGLAADAPVVICIHGAPGSANNFYTYQADSVLLDRALMVSIDRPGYGFSAYGRAFVALSDQAAAVKAVIDKYPERPVILVGHSYGGPIIAKTEMDYPGATNGLVMLAPVNDPEHEKVFWYAYFSYWRATRWMLSKAWRVSGAEKFAHQAELRTMRMEWSKLRVPVVHLHGGKDQLAPIANADFSALHIGADWLRLVRMPESGHLIPFVEYVRTRTEIIQVLEGIEKPLGQWKKTP